MIILTNYIDKAKAYEHFAEQGSKLMETLKNAEIVDNQWNFTCGRATANIQAKFYIMDTPPANVKEIIYAHWILEREPDGKPYCYHCSHCDADFHNIGIKCASKYCPNCGATMSEEIEDNA